MFSPRGTHLHSCRWIFPGSHSCGIRSSCVGAALGLLWRPKALLPRCQQSAKAKAGRPPKSTSQSAVSQPALAAVNYNVPGELVRSKVYQHSYLALSSCLLYSDVLDICATTASLLPFPTRHPAIQGHPPPHALPLPPFPRDLSSHANKPDRAWQRCLPCQQPPLGVRAARLLGCQPLSCGASAPLCHASRACHRCPRHLPASLVPRFSKCFGPHRCNLGKDEVVGASRAVPAFSGACWEGPVVIS